MDYRSNYTASVRHNQIVKRHKDTRIIKPGSTSQTLVSVYVTVAFFFLRVFGPDCFLLLLEAEQNKSLCAIFVCCFLILSTFPPLNPSLTRHT